MVNYLFRRRKLGKTSCENIALHSDGLLEVYRNDDAHIPAGDIVFRWGCTSNLPGRPTIINQARAIHWVGDKKTSRLRFANEGLAPRSSGTWQEWVRDHNTYPVIVRPKVHAQGRHLWKANNQNELFHICEGRAEEYYVSEYIQKEAEYRVFVAQGRAVWVARKTPGNPEDIAWNVARGGRFDNVRWGEWPLGVVDVAIRAFNLTELDFGGVDVMVRGEEVYVLEINSAPSQTSEYRQTCVGKVFAWIIRNGKERMAVGRNGRYLKYIHPALDDKAIL